MIFTSKLATFAALSAASLSVIPVARSATIDVVVGGPGVLKFDPEFITANAGDVVSFTFKQKNHTATQSSFDSPCTPLGGGFDSGFVPVPDAQTSDFTIAQFTVVDGNPVWVYCRQGNHCQQGMVFAVNPGDKFGAFKAAAAAGGPAAPPVTTIAPPPTTPGVVTVTATVTVSGQPLTTTYTTSPGSPAPTTVPSADHKVIVGGPGKLTYDPSNITAQVGDTVTFEFRQKNHTVTTSSFAEPCRALSSTSATEVGFDSGFFPVADSETNFPTYTIRINDTKPIWAYCRQATHCGQGMVFSVNAVESGPNNFAAFQAKAIQLNGTGSVTQDNTNGGVSSASSVHSAGILLTLAGIVLGSFL